MNVAERDALMMADVETLRAAGFAIDEDHADILAPGPTWLAEVAERERRERAEAIARTLAQTDGETLALARELLTEAGAE